MCGPDLKIIGGVGAGVHVSLFTFTYILFKFVIVNMCHHSTFFQKRNNKLSPRSEVKNDICSLWKLEKYKEETNNHNS